MRINKKLVTFNHPFLLDEIEQELPAGNYTIETEEEKIEGSTFLAYRTLNTILVYRPQHSRKTHIQYWEISAHSLSLALERDVKLTQEEHSQNSIYNLANKIGSQHD
ncbi:conserved hypothetical protein [Hirschia baltica ATCC 49814]|uniref:Uncharacterized protein n=1 Tax=Hirschia baltica (strain ATCC 49814 / DSM 5838 / IFAM 1418) TaxID=582402 RepID=C6XI25_HIRBI|nr:conserved hypothetical protein [Hirschia baltica ATCC 49814]